jgi:hypothetical protein
VTSRASNLNKSIPIELRVLRAPCNTRPRIENALEESASSKTQWRRVALGAIGNSEALSGGQFENPTDPYVSYPAMVPS